MVFNKRREGCMELIEKNKCTGCMACVQGCPMNCISIKENYLGHKYPEIDNNICINCGKCMKICPEENKVLAKKSVEAYASWSLNSYNRKTSASGGAASVFYQVAIKNGFYICGVEFDENFEVNHSITNDQSKILKYKQSKYVYSNSEKIYFDIKKKLDLGTHVLFISLPCKIAGLINYLGKKYENLITVDIVCHGTPSYKMMNEHINYVKKNSHPTRLEFREDNMFMFKLLENNKNIYKKLNILDTYIAAFLKGINYRESCYQCSYAQNSRISDITICDFWGLGKKKPFNHPYTGSISAVLINTDKGKSFFEECKDNLFFEERDVSEVLEGNAQLNHPTTKPKEYNKFNELYEKYNFDRAVKILYRKEMLKFIIKKYVSTVNIFIRRIAKFVLKKWRD